MSIGRAALNIGYLLSCLPEYWKFKKALRDPAAMQKQMLMELLRKNRSTRYGVKFRFSEINTVQDFQRTIPIQTYADLEPWTDLIFSGEHQALSASPIKVLERTSGSTSKNKLIPFTLDFLSEIDRATKVWLTYLFLSIPALIGGKSYYSISPNLRAPEFSNGGLRIGMEDDRDYLGPLGRKLVGSLMAVPSTVSQIQDPLAWRRETLFHLLECEDLRLISVWSPTFLQTFIDHLETHDEVLEQRLSAAALKRLNAFRVNGLQIKYLWPRLQVVSFWMDGPSSDFAETLMLHLNGIRSQGKALIATEGVVSTPFGDGPGAPLAITTHFLEFMRLPGREIVLAHELKIGERYSPLLTTGAGFCRYHLQDIVECVGFELNTPRIRFIGKLEAVSDLCGEKLSAAHVQNALHTLTQIEVMSWKQLSPSKTPQPHYVLIIERENAARIANQTAIEIATGCAIDSSIDSSITGSITRPTHSSMAAIEAAEIKNEHLARALDEELRKNVHYDYARKLGQLSEIEVIEINTGASDLYTEFAMSRGMRLGDIKFQPLLLNGGFVEYLRARLENPAATLITEVMS